MGFFAVKNYSAGETLQNFARSLLVKLAIITGGWVGIYFLTQLMREGSENSFNPMVLFNPLVGALAGLAIGWSLAEDAVERSGLTGVVLWVVLTVAGCIPIFVVEAVLGAITGRDIGFGRWMCITAAIIMAMASAVWRASADD